MVVPLIPGRFSPMIPLLSFLLALAGVLGTTARLDAQLGPDLAISGVAESGLTAWGSTGSVAAFSASMGSCNEGDVPIDWLASSPSHPVFVQNLYRVADGRFEQIGMSWAFHGFCSLDLGGPCAPCTPAGCEALGPGCETVNSSAVVGSPPRLGPRSEVDPTTGFFPWPPILGPPGLSIPGGRLRVETDDLDPSLFPGARYFLEIQAVAFDDAITGIIANNLAWREVTVMGGSLTPIGTTRTGEPALFAWREVHPDVEVTSFETIADGRFWMASRAIDQGSNEWRYEYVAFNQTGHLSARSLTVPGAATGFDFSFSDVPYHSGEPIDGTDWTVALAGDTAVWSTETFSTDPLANALRWGTAYSFGLTINAPPVGGVVSLSPFAPGMAPNPEFSALVPDPGIPASFQRGDVNLDTSFDIADPVAHLAQLFLPGTPPPSCQDAADSNDDGALDISDPVYSLAALFVVGAPAPPTPGVICGPDPTPDSLTCIVSCP